MVVNCVCCIGIWQKLLWLPEQFGNCFLIRLCCSISHPWASNVWVCCHQLSLALCHSEEPSYFLPFWKSFCWESHEHPKTLASRLRKLQWEGDGTRVLLKERWWLVWLSRTLWTQERVHLELLHQRWLRKHTGLERKYSLLAHVLFFTHLDFIKWFAT